MHRIACHDCDLVQMVPPLPPEGSARCVRCGSILFRNRKNSIDRTLAWTIAGLVLYGVAVSFPFLTLRSGAIVRETALMSGVQQLFAQDRIGLAAAVMLTCVVVPLLQMLALLALFVPLKLGIRGRHAPFVFRLFRQFRPWSMMEIYLLGILVAMVKLGKMATIIPGLAVAAFGLLVVALICAVSSVDEHLVWERLGGGYEAE